MKHFFTLIFYLAVFFIAACRDNDNFKPRAEEVFPPVEMFHVALYRLDNLAISPNYFKDKWTLIIFGPPSCAEMCFERLKMVNEAKGAQKLFVFDGLAQNKQLRELASRFPSVAISMGTTAASFDNFYSQFTIENVQADDKHDYIYLVGPEAELAFVLSQKSLTSADIDKELEYLK